MALLAYIFRTVHQILMIFAQMLEIVALTDLASVLRARKFSFIIILKALRLAAAVFMYFFNLAAAERPQHCALVYPKIETK